MAHLMNIEQIVRTLPALPSSSVRVMSLLAGGSYELRELEELVRQDEALCAAVLRVGNSVRFGVPGRELALHECVMRLGAHRLMELVLELDVSTLVERAGVSYGLRRQAMWRGSIGGAIVAEHLAHEQFPDLSETCFVGALLRDIGKLAMDAAAGEPMACFGQDVPSGSQLEAERAEFGIDHTQAGAAIAEAWKLPERFVACIRHHHNPPGSASALADPVLDIVHAADAVCLWGGLGVGFDGLAYEVAPHVRSGVLRSGERVQRLIAMAWQRVEEVESLMGGRPSRSNSA